MPAFPRSSSNRPERIVLTPPASARSDSLRSRPDTAWWIATSDEEAGGVHGHRRSFQAQREGDPTDGPC